MIKVRVTSAFHLTAVETWLPLDTKIEDIQASYISPDAFVVEIIEVRQE